MTKAWKNGPGSLTDKQARFVEEYLIDLNTTQAASGRDIATSHSVSKPIERRSILLDPTRRKLSSTTISLA